jgi:hypothetical protein
MESRQKASWPIRTTVGVIAALFLVMLMSPRLLPDFQIPSIVFRFTEPMYNHRTVFLRLFVGGYSVWTFTKFLSSRKPAARIVLIATTFAGIVDLGAGSALLIHPTSARYLRELLTASAWAFGFLLSISFFMLSRRGNETT